MATLAQLRDSIINTADKGRGNRARTYSNLQIEFWIRSTRNFLITKAVEKSTAVLATFEQDLGCVPLVDVDQSECPDFVWGEEVKKCTIPKILDIKNNEGLTFFGLVDKRTRIYVPESNYGNLDDYRRFKPYPNKDRVGYMIGGETIYIKGQGVSKLCAVNVRGIFDDPTLAVYYKENGTPCAYDKNADSYPLPTDLEQVMNQMIFQNYISPVANVPRDKTNDEAEKDIL